VPEDVEQAVRDNAAGPKRAQGDAGSVEQHALRDQIEADRYLESKRASRKRGLGIRLFKLVADGTVGSGREGGC